MKRAYLAGPMSGLPDLNFPAFHRAAQMLRAEGWDIVNPAEINGGADEIVKHFRMDEAERQKHWQACMRNDIAQLVTCDAIFLLPGWRNSKGAQLEYQIATNLGMPATMLGGEPK